MWRITFIYESANISNLHYRLCFAVRVMVSSSTLYSIVKTGMGSVLAERNVHIYLEGKKAAFLGV